MIGSMSLEAGRVAEEWREFGREEEMPKNEVVTLVGNVKR